MISNISVNPGSPHAHVHIHPSTHEKNAHTYMHATHINMKNEKSKTHFKGSFQQENIHKKMVLKFIKKYN